MCEKINFDISGTKYDLLRQISTDLKWNVMSNRNDKKYNLRWYDFYINEDELRRMLPF